MRPKLKLNNISSLHDARYCSAVGVDLLAFNLLPDAGEALTTSQIAEIMEWLSGPESIGEFGYQTPDEIRQLSEAAKINWVSVPFDYPLQTATDLPAQLIFRKEHLLNQSDWDTLNRLAGTFPEALFEFSVEDDQVWNLLKENKLISRSLLRFSSPDPIYTMLTKEGLKPFAFSLGDFVEEPDGHLDYETCDDFIEEFQSLAV